jgi:hypothetical protein
LIGEESAPWTLDGVFRGHYCAHAAKLCRLSGIDVANPRVRVGASQNPPDERAGKLNISDKLGFAGDFVEPFDSLNTPADDGKFFWCWHLDYLSVIALTPA